MKKHDAKTVNQTFSLPLEIYAELHRYVRSRERSRFVAAAIRKEIESKKAELRKAYLAANDDAGQKEVSEEWGNTVGDGVNEW